MNVIRQHGYTIYNVHMYMYMYMYIHVHVLVYRDAGLSGDPIFCSWQ